jgi:prepilin-type processing-associated H-X9-DG protein
MRKHLVWAMAVGVGLALLVVASALAKPHVIRAGNLFLKDDGGIFPSKLPRHSQMPISARIDAEIGTVDGTHPPAVKTLDIDFDKSIEVNARGLPVCKGAQLTARSTTDAKKACSDAVVGSGEGEVEVAFPEQKPFAASGPIVLFNGGVHGGTTLLFVHAYVDVPAPTAVIATVKITGIDRGHYGLHTVSRVPAIAGGAGSVIRFKLTIGRKFTFKGKAESYLTASCPAGRYYTEGNILFADGSALKGTHILPCTPVG